MLSNIEKLRNFGSSKLRSGKMPVVCVKCNPKPYFEPQHLLFSYIHHPPSNNISTHGNTISALQCLPVHDLRSLRLEVVPLGTHHQHPSASVMPRLPPKIQRRSRLKRTLSMTMILKEGEREREIRGKVERRRKKDEREKERIGE